jgi:hypothetical protein
MHGAYLWIIGTSVLYIGCMVPICVLSVRLSYIYDAWCLSVYYRYVCPIYRMHGADRCSSGTSVLYIRCMVIKVKELSSYIQGRTKENYVQLSTFTAQRCWVKDTQCAYVCMYVCMYVLRNMDASSRNHSYRGKAVIITYTVGDRGSTVV